MKKNLLKRGLALLMAFALVVAAIPMSASAADGTWKNPYGDVRKADWYYDAVKFMNYYNFISGTSDTTFSPAMATTRGMFVTILGRIVGTDADSYAGTSRFTDVKAGHWAEPYISWAAANGIVSGIGNNKFGIDDPVTREQSATILYNYLKSSGYDVSVAGNSLSAFSDAGQVSGYARNAMNWIVSASIIAGDGTGGVSPQGRALRSQIAQILMKFVNYKAILDGKTALALPQDAAVAPVDHSAVEGYEDGEHIQYLPNGKVATTLNAQEILFSLQEQYPEGTKWGYEEGACQAYADMCVSALVPNKKEWKVVYKPRIGDIRVGDEVAIDRGAYKSGYVSTGHVVVALKVYSDHIVCTDGNNNGEVSWGGYNVLYDYEIAQGCKYIRTPWKYDDIVREPESETYQIDDFFEPVDVYAATLRNGSAVTSENIRASLADVMEKYPDGTPITKDTPIKVSYYNVSGAWGFQLLCLLTAFDEPFAHTILRENSGFEKIKIGDGLNVQDSDGTWRYYFVLDKTDTALLTATTSQGDVVSWSYVLDKQTLSSSSYAIDSYYYGPWETVK